MTIKHWGCCGNLKPKHDESCQYYGQKEHLTDKELLKLLEPRDEGANAKQIGGEHYKNPIQHWDWVASNDLDYFQGQITKYVARWRHKNGLEDLLKAAHFLEKYIELTRTASAKLTAAEAVVMP